MIDFFTKPLFKHVQKQSHKGGSLEAHKPLNKMNVSPPLNKVSGFLVLKFWWLNSFLNTLVNLINESLLKKIVFNFPMNQIKSDNYYSEFPSCSLVQLNALLALKPADVKYLPQI